MTRKDLLFVYLTRLEKAKFDLEVAEKSRFLPDDVLDKTRLALEVAVRQSLVHVYDGLIKVLQESEPAINSDEHASSGREENRG
jgi:hypothetical protein